MERIIKRFESTKKALKRFEDEVENIARPEVRNNEFYYRARNSAIKSFEFTLDVFWKFMREYVAENYQLEAEIPSPRAVFRLCVDAKLVSEEQFEELSRMVADRNSTAHAYNEELAEEISQRLKPYVDLMKVVIVKVSL